MYRSPAKAARGAIERAIASGRPVPIEVLAQAHAQSPEVVRALAQEYAGDDRVEVIAIDNDGEAIEDAREMRVEDIPHVNEQQARAEFQRAVDEAWAAAHFDHAGIHAPNQSAGLRNTRGEGRSARELTSQKSHVDERSAQRRSAQHAANALSGFTPRLYEAFVGHPPPDARSPLLQSYDAKELAQRQQQQEQAQRQKKQQEDKAEQRTRADAEVGGFTLTGSDRPADVAEAHI